MTPAIFAGVGAIVLIIAIYLANTFAVCTIDLILHDEKDTTARRGANIYVAGTAAGLALLGAAAFYMEHRFVQRLHAVVVVKKTTTVVAGVDGHGHGHGHGHDHGHAHGHGLDHYHGHKHGHGHDHGHGHGHGH
ncbi:hypothetical protein BDZ88DRAFT_453936 [Geranomyces variabilis]|nr:hypothetical protein BDZ88DRAFT_453936 [Geranomyces variabilis]